MSVILDVKRENVAPGGSKPGRVPLSPSERLRVLVVSQIYLPEMGALANRMYPIVRRLVEAGHSVSVATGMPNYPEGVIFPGYQGRRVMREEIEGAAIYRTASHITPRNRSKWAQLRSYLSFIPAAYRSGLRAGKQDVVFVTSPPIFPAVAGIWLARRSRAKLVFDVRDLWPDEIVACGAGKEGSPQVRLVRAIERWVYREADCVTCTTPSFVKAVSERGVAKGRAVLLPNGADTELFRPMPPRNPVADSLPFGGRFVVMYSGLLGIKHGLEVVLEAAKLLRGEREILFCLVGSGARREALEGRARELGLDNVLFTGERPLAELPLLQARADLCLSALLPEPYLEKIISVKLFEYLACEKPVVAAQAGEGAQVLEDSGGGLVTPPGDARALAEAVRALYRDPRRREQMGRAGRRYVLENYSRSEWAGQLETLLRDLCARR